MPFDARCCCRLCCLPVPGGGAVSGCHPRAETKWKFDQFFELKPLHGGEKTVWLRLCLFSSLICSRFFSFSSFPLFSSALFPLRCRERATAFLRSASDRAPALSGGRRRFPAAGQGDQVLLHRTGRGTQSEQCSDPRTVHHRTARVGCNCPLSGTKETINPTHRLFSPTLTLSGGSSLVSDGRPALQHLRVAILQFHHAASASSRCRCRCSDSNRAAAAAVSSLTAATAAVVRPVYSRSGRWSRPGRTPTCSKTSAGELRSSCCAAAVVRQLFVRSNRFLRLLNPALFEPI